VTGATGSYRLIFAADGYRSATSDKFDVVKAGTTTDISGQGTSTAGEPVTFNFNVTSTSPGTPSGNVQIRASDTEQCTAPAPQGSCQITFTGTGERAVTATYSGDDFFASSTSVTVTQQVNEPANNPPTASFTHADCVSGSPCQFTDTSTDPEGNINKWEWDFGDFSEPSPDQNPQHTFIVGAGFTYHVTLTVTDSQGASNSTSQDVTVP
jgi:PKD repeat protein